MFTEKKIIYFLFLLCLASRLIFKWLMPYDNFYLFEDAYRYDELSNRILAGNLDLDVTTYLTAPLYPYTLAFFKFFIGVWWETAVILYQFILVSFSVVYLFKISQLLFRNNNAAVLAGLMYIFYPLTLWYNFTLVQETSFQAFFILFLYHFIRSSQKGSLGSVVCAAFFFGLAMLTKSHIIILIPFLVVVLLLNKRTKQGLLFSSIVFLMTIPHGLVNYNLHNIYTLSSYGNASLFLLGHSDATYPCLTATKANMGEFSSAGCDPAIVSDSSYVYPSYGKVSSLSPKQRNAIRFSMATKWISQNPKKFLKLKWDGLKRFIMPGLDYRMYKTTYWLVSLLLGLLIYIPAYIVLFSAPRLDWNAHLLAYGLLGLVAVVFLLFLPMQRFRVITLEPYLMVYASYFYSRYFISWNFIED